MSTSRYNQGRYINLYGDNTGNPTVRRCDSRVWCIVDFPLGKDAHVTVNQPINLTCVVCPNKFLDFLVILADEVAGS